MNPAASKDLELRVAEAIRSDPSGGSLLESPIGPLLVTAYAYDKPLWLRCLRVMRSEKLQQTGDIRKAIKEMAERAAKIPQIGRATSRDEEEESDCVRTYWTDAPKSVTKKTYVPQNYRIEGPPQKPAISLEKRKIGSDNQVEVTLVPVSINPILITRLIAMVSSKAYYTEISHRTRNKWRTLIVPQSVAFNHRRFTDVLLDKGVMATAVQAPEICAWLLSYWDENQDQIPVMYGASELGWQGPNSKYGFLLGRKQICAEKDQEGKKTLEVEFHSESTEDEIAEYRTVGTMEGWLEICRSLSQFPAMRIAVYASLAAPLINVLGIGNCLIDFACTTSKGKSTALRLADSCWRTKQEALPNWDTTLAAIEDRARRLNDLPLIIDETQLLESTMAGRFVYGIVGGRTRGRAARNGEEKTAKMWRTILMTSGEQPVSEHANRAGAAARSLSILQSPLGPQTDAAGALANHVRDECGRHCGHAGEAVVRWLVEHRSEWNDLRDAHRDRAAKLRGASGAQNRMADVIALLEISSMIVHKAIPEFPWPDIPLSEDPLVRPLLAESVTHAVEASDEGTRAFEFIMSVAAQNPNRWWHELYKGAPPSQGWFGRHDTAKRTYCWFPAALKLELERGKYPVDAVLRAWRERGWLEAEAGRSGYTKKVAIGEDKPRLTVLRIDAMGSGSDDPRPIPPPPPDEDGWSHGD